jgi:hypothetical protein
MRERSKLPKTRRPLRIVCFVDNEENQMPNLYVEARPKGGPEGSAIDDYVVEDHADHVLATFKTQRRSTGPEIAAMPRLSRAYGI